MSCLLTFFSFLLSIFVPLVSFFFVFVTFSCVSFNCVFLRRLLGVAFLCVMFVCCITSDFDGADKVGGGQAPVELPEKSKPAVAPPKGTRTWCCTFFPLLLSKLLTSGGQTPQIISGRVRVTRSDPTRVRV